MKKIIILFALLTVAVITEGRNVQLEWDAPKYIITEAGTELMDSETLALLRYTVYSTRYGETNWTPIVTATNTMSDVQLSVGAWVLAVTAKIGDYAYSESDMSSGLVHKIYGKVVQVEGVRILVIGD